VSRAAPGRSRGRGRALGPLLVAGIVSCSSLPFEGDTGIKPFGFDLWDVRCPSGLRVIVERAPGVQRAGVTTIVGTGGLQDPPGREGLAHLVEHLLFRAAPPPETNPMRLRLLALGAIDNAHTSHEETLYYAFVPPQSLKDVLSLEGRLFANPLAGVDEATFAVERDIVRNELRQHHETETMSEGWNAARRAAFPADHPYSRPVIGTHESLSRLTLEDARRYVAKHYRPEAMTMVVVGDVDLAQSEAFVRAALPPELYGDPTHPRPHAPPRLTPEGPPPLTPPAPLRRIEAAVATPELWIAWPTQGGFGTDRYLAETWTWLADTRLHRSLLNDRDIASVSCDADPDVLASMFACRIKLTEGKHPEESLRQVLDALPWIDRDSQWFEHRVTAIKLAQLRNLSLGAESARRRGEARAQHAHYTGQATVYGTLVDNIQHVTVDGLDAFAERWLGRERARAVLIEPVRTAEPPKVIVSAAQDLSAIEKTTPLPPIALGNLTNLRHLNGLRSVTLDNGLQLLLLARPGASVVTTTLALHGGRTAAAPGVAAATLETIEPNWQESPGAFGIHLHYGAGMDATTMTIQAGAANLPRALDMLSFAARSYDLDWPSEKFQTTRLPLLRRQDAQPSSQTVRALWTKVFPDHPYGTIATPDQMAATTKAAINDWLDRTMAPRNAALIIVGDIDVPTAEAAARSAFGGWSESAGPIAAPAPAMPGTQPVSAALPGGTSAIVTHRPRATQAELHMMCVLPPADARQGAVYDLAADVLESALWLRLREDTGATYGVNAYAETLRGGTAYIAVSADIYNGRFAGSMDAIRAFWRSSQDEELSPKRFARARDSRARARLLSHEMSTSLSDALVESWNRGWPLTSIDDEASLLATIRSDEVSAALRDCARSLVLAVTGDEKVVRAALKPRPTAAKAESATAP
jgi:zinc protease